MSDSVVENIDLVRRKTLADKSAGYDTAPDQSGFRGAKPDLSGADL
jgi:hypothetical protein